MKEYLEQLMKILPMERIRVREDMSRHTTFRAGGQAAYLVEPETAEEITSVQTLCRRENIPYYILGNGSNLLVSDKGYDGVVLLMGKLWSTIEQRGSHLYAGAGAMLSAIAKYAWNASLSGLEFAAGIPGTLGGGVVMNAGAYGSELKDVLISATVLTPEGEIKIVPVSQLQLGYRTSCIPVCGYVVLGGEFQLKSGEAEEMKARMDELAFQRKSKQPLEYPSAGSTFKRPEGHFAGKLIQDANLRGFTVGGAQISEKHCGFVINRDHATAEEIKELCDQVQSQVLAHSGVLLELEVKLLGEF